MKKTEVVRYDNSNDEMSQDFVFTSNQTRKLKVKVYVPESDGGEMSSGLSGSSYACVGLLLNTNQVLFLVLVDSLKFML